MKKQNPRGGLERMMSGPSGPPVRDIRGDLQIVEGWLTKKGGRGGGTASRHNWKRRWFKLRMDPTRDGNEQWRLEYYPSEGDARKKKRPKGFILLNGSEVKMIVKDHKKKGVEHEFQIQDTEGQILEVYAENKPEKEAWLTTLITVTNHCQELEFRLMRNLRNKRHHGMGRYVPELGEFDAVNWQRGEDEAQACEAYGPGLFGTEAGMMTMFTVQTYDPETGDAMNEGGMPFTATLSNDTLEYNLRVEDMHHDDGEGHSIGEPGTYQVTYQTSCPGDYELSVKVNDEHHIQGSPFAVLVTPAPTSAGHCQVRGDGIDCGTSGETCYFTIVACDAFGSARTQGGDPFEVTITGPAVLQSLRDNGDGKYAVTYSVTATDDTCSQVPDAVRIDIKLAGVHIPGSPFVPLLERADTGMAELQSQSLAPVAAGMPTSQRILDEQAEVNLRGGMANANPSEKLARIAARARQQGSTPQQHAVTAELSQSPFGPSYLGGRTGGVNFGSSSADANQMLSAMGRANLSGKTPTQRMTGANATDALGRAAAAARAAANAPSPLNRNTAPDPARVRNALKQRQQFLDQQINSLEAQRRAAGLATTPGYSAGRSPPAHYNVANDLQSATKTTGFGQAGRSAEHSSERLANAAANVAGLKPDRHGLQLRSPPAPSPGDAREMKFGLPPEKLTAFEKQLWAKMDRIEQDPEVAALLERHSTQLQVVFGHYCYGSGGGAGGRAHAPSIVLGSSHSHKGMIQLTQDYDIAPTFLSKKEVKACFTTVHTAHEGDGQGLGFDAYVQLLALLAVQALSKDSFAHLYPTDQSKVTVLLEMWGLGDPVKLEMIRHRESARYLGK